MPAMIPLAGAYAEGKGVPKSMFESYKWLAIAERWNVTECRRAARAGRSRAEAGRDREGQGRRHRLHLQDQMIVGAGGAARGAARRRSGRPRAAERRLRRRAAVARRRRGLSRRRSRHGRSPTFARWPPTNADAEAWLGAVLLDRGRHRKRMQALQHAADAGSAEGAHRLALVFAEGLAGTPRNDARALAAVREGRGGRPSAGPDQCRHRSTSAARARRATSCRRAPGSRRLRRRNDPYALYALGRAMDESAGASGMADPVRAADLYRRAAAARPSARGAALRPGAERRHRRQQESRSRPSSG